jgi:hypothetical protein
MKLAFGEIVKATEKELTTRDKATITVSLQLAKRLAEILANNVASYEEKFGPIHEAPK